MGKTTKFEEELKRLRSIIEQSDELSAALKAAELADEFGAVDDTTRKYRLPYSSNPKPIGKPWRSD